MRARPSKLPTTLRISCESVTCCASRLMPMLASTMGVILPMLIPMIIGAATAKEIVPVAAASVCRIPTEAEELWSIEESRIPSSSPTSGFENVVNTWLKDSELDSGPSADSIVLIPKKRIPKPIRQEATLFAFFFLLISMMNAPIPIRSGAKAVGLSRDMMELPEPEISARRRI